MNKYQQAILDNPFENNDTRTEGIRDHYQILDLRNPKFTETLFCKIAYFDEFSKGFSDSVLRHQLPSRIGKFMLAFDLIEVLTNEAKVNFDELLFRPFYSENPRKIMIVLTTEDCFKIWQDFSYYEIKSYETNLPIAFRRY